MRVLHLHRFPLHSHVRTQVDDVSLLCPPPPLHEEESYCGDGHEPGNTSDNGPSDDASVTCGSTLIALLITSFTGRICCSWRGVGSRRGSSSFWVSPNRFCERGIEIVLFLIQPVQVREQWETGESRTHGVIEIGPMRYCSILWDVERVSDRRSDKSRLRKVRSYRSHWVT